MPSIHFKEQPTDIGTSEVQEKVLSNQKKKFQMRSSTATVAVATREEVHVGTQVCKAACGALAVCHKMSVQYRYAMLIMVILY